MDFIFENNQLKAFENQTEVGNVLLGKQSEKVYRVLRVFVSEQKRGQGISGALMKEITSIAYQNNFLLIPVCSYAVSYFKKNVEFQDIIFNENK